MRMLMTVQLDTPAANTMLADGSMQEAMAALMEQIKPEAAYFAPHDGCRSAYLVFDMKDPSQMVTLTEPLFQSSLAKIDLVPVMDFDDLQRGMQSFSGEG